MNVYAAESANDAWSAALHAVVGGAGHAIESRSGSTREILHSALVITDPRQRWVASRTPPINPAFALAEVCWIVAGRRDVAFLRHWNKRYPDFIGNTPKAYGAYGHRLKAAFHFDQLYSAYHTLRSNPGSRQCVLQLWSASTDLPRRAGKPRSGDIPCNISACLRLAHDRLEWLQTCRSNDLILGFPYNAVQFMSLQEILAGWIGVELGTYTHVVSSMHVYDKDIKTYQSDPNVLALPSPLDWRIPFKESTQGWRSLNEHAQLLVDHRGRTPRGLRRPAQNSLPRPMLNAYSLLAAEDARCRGWRDEVDAAIQSCTDPLLRFMWTRWCAPKKRLGSPIASAN